MYETIYVEKNKSSRFGIHIYDDSAQWKVFCENCGIAEKKYAAICNADLQADEWKSLVLSFDSILEIKEDDDTAGMKIREFLDQHKGNTFVILNEPFIMEALQDIMTNDDAKISYIFVPVTPFSFFDAISLKPQADKNGEIIRKELFPVGVYADISILIKAKTEAFLGGVASAFRLSISHKASMFEWMIYNLYELLDCEKDTITELLTRGYHVQKERIEKDTAKERSLPIYGYNFYKILKEGGIKVTDGDLWSLAMVCQSYLSWKSELLSMEEYYEIRDMFVAFGLSISETDAPVEMLMNHMENSKYNLLFEKELIFIRKIGKILLHETPGREVITEAFEQIYYNEEAND